MLDSGQQQKGEKDADYEREREKEREKEQKMCSARKFYLSVSILPSCTPCLVFAKAVPTFKITAAACLQRSSAFIRFKVTLHFS